MTGVAAGMVRRRTILKDLSPATSEERTGDAVGTDDGALRESLLRPK
jgi:hypothetical protein